MLLKDRHFSTAHSNNQHVESKPDLQQDGERFELRTDYDRLQRPLQRAHRIRLLNHRPVSVRLLHS
jgi:hypothetical protein